ncbi:MAG: gephyrin-like molybdotransferase Glp [Acidobacteriaceae bacterium]
MEQRLPQPGCWPQIASDLVSFAEAVASVTAQATAILAGQSAESQECDLSDALGRVLAHSISASRDQPPFDRVTRDGYAVRSRDFIAGVPLRVVGQLRAGEPWATRPPLLPGEAIEVMTGAALPLGADAVVMVEHVEEAASHPAGRAGDRAMDRSIVARSERPLRPGENVIPCGSEARCGNILLEPGTRLRPEEIALAATCGLRSVPVCPAPRVAILATGDELVEAGNSVAAADTNLEPHQIYDSNSHSLAALVRQNNAIPVRLHAAPDRRQDLAASFQQGLQAAPLLLVSGGVSMGRYDLVEDVLASLGAEFFFTGVRMQPGKPVVFGRVPAAEDRPPRFFFGLPGNPISTMITFRALVQPLLAALAGQRDWQPQIILAILSSDVPCKPGLTRFLAAHLDTRPSNPTVTAISTQGSGDLAGHARANCFLIVPEDCERLQAGNAVRVLLQ